MDNTEVSKPVLQDTVVRTPGMTRQEFRRRQREVDAKFGANRLTRTGLKKEQIPTIKIVMCPSCSKDRLGKYLGEDGNPLPISSETIEVRGETRFLDVCGVCSELYNNKDRKFLLDSLKQIQKAARAGRLSRETNEKDFNIDL